MAVELHLTTAANEARCPPIAFNGLIFTGKAAFIPALIPGVHSHGALRTAIERDPDGLVREIAYGDGAATTTPFGYDDLRRLRNLTTARAKAPHWPTDPTVDQRYSQQMLLQDEQLTYDRVGNPTEIRDWRLADEWPAGSKPVTRKLKYDDLYRLAQVTRIDVV